MGANAVNTIAEGVAPLLAEIAGVGHLRILSNLTDRRCACAEVAYHLEDLATDRMDGAEVGQAVELASLFAEADRTAQRPTTRGS
jgi:hydroxymethylglutaryl-CoA reductase